MIETNGFHFRDQLKNIDYNNLFLYFGNFGCCSVLLLGHNFNFIFTPKYRRWSGSCLHVPKRHSTSLGFYWYGTKFPGFRIISRARKRLATIERSTSNDSASCSWVWQKSWSSNVSSSLSTNFFSCQSLMS